MSVVRLDEDDLDEEDLAILKEVAKKGYYHNRPKSESCAAPQRVEEVSDKSPEVKGRAAFDAFQAKWDRFDNEDYLEAVIDEIGEKFAVGPKDSTASVGSAQRSFRHVAEFKILLIGEKAVGKTSFLLRHQTGEFSRSGAARDTEVVSLRFATTCGEIVFNVWELNPSAEERGFGQGQAAILMYDMGARASWRSVPNCLRDIKKFCGSIPVVLVGNKADVGAQWKEQTRSARVAFQQKRRLQFFETSAKTCYNLEKPFWWLSRRLSGCPSLELASRRAVFPEVHLQAELFAQHGRELAEAARTPEKVKVAQTTEAKINTVSENYRLVANRGSLLFFLMMELCKMHSFYKYSLDAFVMVVTRAITLVTLRKVKEMLSELLHRGRSSGLVSQPMSRSIAWLTLGGKVLLASITEVPDDVFQARIENSLKVSLEDLFLAAGRRYEPLFSQEQLESVLEDHLGEREADASWESPPRRAASGSSCTIRPDSVRPSCPVPNPYLCIDRLLPLLFQEVNHAMAFIYKQVEVLEAVSMATGTSEWSTMPPLSGKAFASMAALEAVLGLFLGLLERTDFNPGLAACLMTPLGRKLQETMLTVLGDHQKLSSEVNDMRWQLAAFRRLAHARYGLQWHADTALHIAAQAGWTLFHLAKLDGYFLQRLGLHEQTFGDGQENFTDALPLLWQEPSEVDMEGDVQTDWTLELRSALHSGGSLWHLDKGLLRFLLSMVLHKGDIVCDLGAFGGHYSEWLNDTGLVSAYAFDAIPGVEEITKGAVRHARLDAQDLELVDAGCDVVLCLEVMEHILPSMEQQALSNLGLHTKRALVLSWAPPWVPGPGHINQRPPEEAWAEVEKQTGLARQPILSEGAQASSSLSWVRESVAVFTWPQAMNEEEIVELTGQELTNRVKQLEGVVTFAVFAYLRRGLLDADKLTVASMLALKILVRSGEVHPEELNILIRAPVDPLASPMPDTTRSWLTEHQWAQLKTLEQVSVFKTGSNALTSTLEQDRYFRERTPSAGSAGSRRRKLRLQTCLEPAASFLRSIAWNNPDMDADSATLSEYDTQLYWPLDTSMAADAARRLRQRFLGARRLSRSEGLELIEACLGSGTLAPIQWCGLLDALARRGWCHRGVEKAVVTQLTKGALRRCSAGAVGAFLRALSTLRSEIFGIKPLPYAPVLAVSPPRWWHVNLSPREEAALELASHVAAAQPVLAIAPYVEAEVAAAFARLGCRLEHGQRVQHMQLPLSLPDLGTVVLCLQPAGMLQDSLLRTTFMHPLVDLQRLGWRVEVILESEWPSPTAAAADQVLQRQQEVLLRRKLAQALQAGVPARRRKRSALTHFVQANLGQEFVEQSPFDMNQVYEDSTCLTPIFFVLFPGTDPTPVIEATAAEFGLTQAAGSLHNISMGQGQENVAINAINKCARDGHWVVLQNIHLMQEWLKQLERSLELIEEFVHPNFRCILTSEPPSTLQGPLWPLLPEAILQKCIKIADEAPTDLKTVSGDHVDACHKPREYKATLFALCFFHALVLGRIKFGPQGWSKKYPFNDGDLTICAQVLCNYLNNSEKIGSEVPWPDIRYIFGEIMYGGHITDQWDRRVCNTYLVTLVIPELLSNMSLAPGLKSPDASKMEYASYQKYIEDRFPTEMPQLFGLHPNAEIGFLTSQGINIFKTVQMVSGADSGAATVDLLACLPLIAKYKDELPPDLDMPEIRGRLREEDYTPYESDRMNVLVGMIRNSLTELELGISGALNITEGMEALSTSLQSNRVNDSWQKLAYPSLKPLSGWFADLLSRMEQLVEWTNERSGLLKSSLGETIEHEDLDLGALQPYGVPDSGHAGNSQKQAASAGLHDQQSNHPEHSGLLADSTDIVGLPVNGVHIHGLFLEGASWEEGKGDDEGYISDSKMKELHPEMPVINIFSVHINEMSWDNMYHCPVFITPERGATYVTQVNVRMDPDDDEKRWILAGAALVMTDD
eukprot:s1439_g13.t3